MTQVGALGQPADQCQHVASAAQAPTQLAGVPGVVSHKPPHTQARTPSSEGHLTPLPLSSEQTCTHRDGRPKGHRAHPWQRDEEPWPSF